MTYKINLVIGDWSGDSNGLKETYVIESNLSAKQIEAAYTKATKLLKINLITDVCDQGEAEITKDQLDKFVAHGANLSEIFGYDQATIDKHLIKDKKFWIEEDGFLNLYLFTIKLGDPSFTYEFVTNNNETINIGGNSLFC